MDIRVLAVASLPFFLVLMAAAGAEDVKIMGLMDTNAVRSDSQRSLAYLTGSCQHKHKRMKCHLNEIEVTKLDTTLFKEKAKEVMEQVTQDPHHVDSVIERQMPYLCPDSTAGQERLAEPSQSAPSLPASKSCGKPHGTSVPRRRSTRCARCWTCGSPCKRGPVRCGSTAMRKILRAVARSG